MPLLHWNYITVPGGMLGDVWLRERQASWPGLAAVKGECCVSGLQRGGGGVGGLFLLICFDDPSNPFLLTANLFLLWYF